MYVFLASLGFTIIAEDATNRGRIDLTLKVPGRTYIIEFKVDMPNESALHQIRTKKYYEKYRAEGVEICLVGIHFSKYGEEYRFAGVGIAGLGELVFRCSKFYIFDSQTNNRIFAHIN